MSQRGFTMVEVLIAMAILMIGVLAGAKLMGEGIRQGAVGRKTSTAQQLANQIIENLRIEVRFDLEAAAGTGTVGGAAFAAADAWKAERLPYSSHDSVGAAAGASLTTCNPAGAEDDPEIDYNVGPLPYRFEGNSYWVCYQIEAPNSATCLSDAACVTVKVLWPTERGHQAHRAVAYLTSGR